MGYFTLSPLYKIFRGTVVGDKTGTPARTAAQGLNENADKIDAALEAINTASEKTANKVQNLDAPNATSYPSSIAVKNAIDAIDGVAIQYTDTQLTAYQAKSEKGIANGYAGLDANAKIPAANMYAVMDEVIEGTYVNTTTFNDTLGAPVTPGEAKLYQDITTGNTNSGKQFRWGGTQFSETVSSPGTTDQVVEGSSNLYFTGARVRATILTGLTTLQNAAIASADTVLIAFGKIQAQINALGTSIGLKLDKGTYNGTAQDLANLANSKETTAGAQSKADAAEQAAKDYAVSLAGNTIPVETFTNLAGLVLEEDILYLVKDENVIYTYDDVELAVFPINPLTSAKIIAALGITPANDAEVVKGVKTSDGTTLTPDANRVVTLPKPVIETFNSVLTFNKDKFSDVVTQSASIAYSLVGSGNTDGFTIKHKITSDGINTITFPTFWNVFNKSTDDIYPAGLQIIYFNYMGGEVDVVLPSENAEASAVTDNELKVYQIPESALTATPTDENIQSLVAAWFAGQSITKLDIQTIGWEVIETVVDTTAPSVPTGLAASNITDTTATITWNASTD